MNDQCPCGIARATCEYHADGFVSHAQAIASGQTSENPKRTIQRLCAAGRLEGIRIHTVLVDSAVFEQLRGTCAPIAKAGADGVEVLTANGVCEVWRRK